MARSDDPVVRKVPLLLQLRKTQCENWFEVTPLIAEFWCCLSNIPFLVLGFSFWPLSVVGTLSLLHHMIPYEWLRLLDMVGANLLIGWCLLPGSLIWSSWELLLHGLCVLVLLLADGYYRYFSPYPSTPWPHVLWHLGAAGFMAHLLFLS